MEREEIKRFAMAALQYTADGELEKAATIVSALAGTGDVRDVYGACCAWAGSAEVALERIHGQPDGGLWTADGIRPGAMAVRPERTFALRFIAAYANDDPPTTEALFIAATKASGDQGAKSIACLLQMAADINAEAQTAA
jgi:hypothetical protein